MTPVRPSRVSRLTAVVGAVLLVAGIALAAVDAHQRSDAATAAASLTPEQVTKLSQSGFGWDLNDMRRWMIVDNLVSGGPMPTLLFEEDDAGQAWVSWGAVGGGQRVGSAGGWQPKPIALLPAVGLALLLGSVFLAAARWRPQHPPAEDGLAPTEDGLAPTVGDHANRPLLARDDPEHAPASN